MSPKCDSSLNLKKISELKNRYSCGESFPRHTLINTAVLKNMWKPRCKRKNITNILIAKKRIWSKNRSRFETLLKSLGRKIELFINPLTTNVPYRIETSQLICIADQLTVFYMMGNIGRLGNGIKNCLLFRNQIRLTAATSKMDRILIIVKGWMLQQSWIRLWTWIAKVLLTPEYAWGATRGVLYENVFLEISQNS